MPDHDPAKTVTEAILDKFDAVLREWWTVQQIEEGAKKQLSEAEERKKLIHKAYDDCLTAARLFEFDLDKAWEERQDRLRQRASMQENMLFAPPPAQPSTTASELATVIAAATVTAGKPKTIKDRILEAAQQAYPSPVRASELRKLLAASGIVTHPKTIGMSLYRLLRSRNLRREGWNWFFVPSAGRESPETRGQESPGDQPGLVETAT